MTPRQDFWLMAARDSEPLAAGLFALIAQPNRQEREHDCREHATGFRHAGRRGFRCGVCDKIVKWMDS